MPHRPRIAHLAGPTATIQNTPPLVTSNKARAKHGLKPRANPDGTPQKFDALRAQRLAAPAKVYVEQFSAHPLESDRAELYAAPDGYIGADGSFSKTRKAATDKPVYEVELKPEDGLYPLPYMGVQADGSAWEEESSAPGAPAAKSRQGFFPDGSRSFEEIDRLGVDHHGLANRLSSVADIAFHRVAPPGGFTRGLPEKARKDHGKGDIAQEAYGRDFFPYNPRHLGVPPARPVLAKITNDVQRIVAMKEYDGFIWTQGSPQVEEIAYWFNLLIDTTKPICCNAAQRPQGMISNDGPMNIVSSAQWIASRIWADGEGRNRCGTVVIQEQQVFAAREVAKADARPGGYVATGGHGGILGQLTHADVPKLMYLPAYRHTWQSDVTLKKLPKKTRGVRNTGKSIETFSVQVKDAKGNLTQEAIPAVSIIKDGGFTSIEFGEDPALEGDLLAAIAHKLWLGKLAGFIVEGLVPYGNMTSKSRLQLMTQAVFSGLPVARVGRGAPEGFADDHPLLIAGSNLTATKARLLLMACLMKFGALPVAKDPTKPTPAEIKATQKAVRAYQAVFDTH